MPAATSSKSRPAAVFQALFVTFLWSTSWVLIKTGLKADLPPVTFAGLRYTLAFFCLLPFVWFNKDHIRNIRNLPARSWLELILLGFVFYTLTQGAQFVSLAFLPAATLTLLLNFSPVLIALYSLSSAREPTPSAQWGGIFLSIAGALIYFLPLSVGENHVPGLTAGLIALSANAAASILGRRINSPNRLHPLIVTTISMGAGGVLMLIIGVGAQGFGVLTVTGWGIIGWLALVNTAFAFTLWNKSLQTLTAVESSVINGTMLPQIAVLGWLFLDEPLGGRQILGLAFVASGALIVQLHQYLPFKTSFTAQSK
jgi:drug/metabolite transporter (DMT)-like permease